MNVIQSDKRPFKSFTKTKNELVRKDAAMGMLLINFIIIYQLI